MASLNIPETFRQGLSLIINLDETSAQEFIEALKHVLPAIYRKDVSARLAEKLSSIPPTDVREMVDALFGLSVGRSGSDVSVPQFVDDVLDTLSQDTEHKTITDENRAAIKQRLQELLDIDILRIGAKAFEVLFEHEHNLTAARILTDVRPVFGDNVAERPMAAIIVHNLRISYMDAGQRREFFVALDTSDIEKLMKTVERAKVKADSLKALLATTDVPYVDAE
jgi:hypothetical protein